MSGKSTFGLLDLYDVTVVIRWWADVERDAWYLEDLYNRSDKPDGGLSPGRRSLCCTFTAPGA
jgi:hypothetical protein